MVVAPAHKDHLVELVLAIPAGGAGDGGQKERRVNAVTGLSRDRVLKDGDLIIFRRADSMNDRRTAADVQSR